VPSRDELTLAWADVVLPALSPRAKSRYAAGRFVEGGATAARLALPNEPHLKRCEELRADVEAALAAHFGRPVPLELVVDDGKALAGAGSSASGAAGTPAPAADEVEDVGSMDDLVDAGAGDLVLERIEQHFPGAEEVAAERG
jgi:hypothetical protein